LHISPIMQANMDSTVDRCAAPAGRSALVALALLILAGCIPAPPTEVVDLRDAPQATRDALLRVQILPLGVAAPPDVGAVATVSSYGCGSTPVAASTDAIEQLRAKALLNQATAVMDVLLGPGGPGPCNAGYSATASGMALAARGVPPTW
jgi:hypothetical protein